MVSINHVGMASSSWQNPWDFTGFKDGMVVCDVYFIIFREDFNFQPGEKRINDQPTIKHIVLNLFKYL